jgi:hypothetical protein
MSFMEFGNRISVSIDGVFGADELRVATIPIGVFVADINLPEVAG